MTLTISRKHKVVAVPDLTAVANLYPNAHVVTIGAFPHRVVPHDPVATALLRKLGYDVAAPILHHYGWQGGTPFDVQRKTCALLTQNERAYVLNSMGTGKTKAALWAWDYLYQNDLAQKLLVVAPLSTLTFTWAREVFSTLPNRHCVVLHGSKQKRLERLN